MSVTNKEGIKLDLNQVRDQLSKDRDAGRVSKKDYNKAMKGINRIADADKKGVNYTFTGDSRFKTTTGNGRAISGRDAGVSVSSKLPLSGRNVSKAMGYASSIGLTVPEESPTVATKDFSGTPALQPINKINTGTPVAPGFKMGHAPFLDSAVQKPEEKVERSPEFFAEDADRAIEKTKKDLVLKENDLLSQIDKLEAERKSISKGMTFGAFDLKLGENQGIYYGNDDKVSAKTSPLYEELRKIQDTKRKYGMKNEREALPGIEFNPTNRAKDPFYNPMISLIGASALVNSTKLLGSPDIIKNLIQGGDKIFRNGQRFLNNGQKLLNPGQKMLNPGQKMLNSGQKMLNAPQKALPAPVQKMLPAPKFKWNLKNYRMGTSVQFKEGGKIRKFGWGTNGTNAIQDSIAETEKRAQLQKRINFSNLNTAIKSPNIGARKFGIQTQALAKPKLKTPGISLVNPSTGNRKTLKVDRTRIGNAYNQDSRSLDKDSLINTAMGVYGAASLLTAKKPTLRAPEDIKLNIRPAQGDEEMVSRSNNAIDESVRQGTGMLRTRTGSDLQSYVQGATAMVDNAGKAKSSVLGQNSQMKRQDENRMSNEINQGKQINYNAKESFKKEQNFADQQSYAQRVGGAQAAVNNSLNYGVQKRAHEKNQEVERNTMEKRYGTTMLSLAETLRSQGMGEQEIIAYLRDLKKISSFKKGGSLDSEAISISASENISKANSELRKMFATYSKLISQASIENIRQFNANIRAVNNRKNITITSR